MRLFTVASMSCAVLALTACTRDNPAATESALTVAMTSTKPADLSVVASLARFLPAEVAVMITVEQVDVHIATGQVSEGADDGEWITLSTTPVRINLLEAERVAAILGDHAVPAGRVTQVRLRLADDAVLIADGKSIPLSCPSCSDVGLKIVVANADAVAGGHLQITLDFDQQLSVLADRGNAELRPVIRIMSAN